MCLKAPLDLVCPFTLGSRRCRASRRDQLELFHLTLFAGGKIGVQSLQKRFFQLMDTDRPWVQLGCLGKELKAAWTDQGLRGNKQCCTPA